MLEHLILSHRSQTCISLILQFGWHLLLFQLHWFFPLPYPGSHKANPINFLFLTQYSSFISIWIFLILYNSDKILYLLMNALLLDFFFHFSIVILKSLSDNSNSIPGSASTDNLQENPPDTGSHCFLSCLIIFYCMPDRHTIKTLGDSLYKRTLGGCLGDLVG